MIRLERIHLLSRADKLQPLRNFVRELASQQGCCDENLDCMVMAINEACMNVMQHAYGGREDGEIIVEFWKDENELLVRIFDFAEKVDLHAIKSRDLDEVRPGGLGVHIIHQVMDSVEYKNHPESVGNVLEMRKQLSMPVKCGADTSDKNKAKK